MALNTAVRKPEMASSTIMMPSITTRPIASAQVRPCWPTMVTATSVLIPKPAAMPKGYLATRPNKIHITPAAKAVAAATCGMPSTVPSRSGLVPMISGLSSTMYAIAKKVTTPARTSVLTVDPRSVMWKKASSPPRGCGWSLFIFAPVVVLTGA